MKAHVAAPAGISRGIHRVADALARYAPADVEIVADAADADVVVGHVIGAEGIPEWVDARLSAEQRYALFMYCLRTTAWPHPVAWTAYWQGAAVVASYYDLAGMWRQAAGSKPAPNFLRVPLGVDTSVFNAGDWGTAGKHFLVGTSGYVASTECVGEWGTVCNNSGSRQFHLGPDLPELAHQRTLLLGGDDEILADYWRHCAYVSGLRRSEGFELPMFEGLACGARPVAFDREDARFWLGDHAEYVTEGSPESVVEQLSALADEPYRIVTSDEIDWVRKEFSWQTMAAKFWKAVSR